MELPGAAQHKSSSSEANAYPLLGCSDGTPYVVAKTGELTDQELSHTIFPHPTLSEMMHEAVLAADGASLHI